MRFLMKLVVLAAILLGGVWVYGRSLPREHRESSSITLVAQSDSVFATMRDIKGTAGWWSDVRSVRPLTGQRRESWEQDMKGSGPLRTEITSVTDGQRLVTTILNDEQKDWGGKWTYVVTRTGAGTEVTITEDGWIDPPIHRVLLKLRGGPHRTLDSYLRSLGAHFGETVNPRHGAGG